MKFLLAAVCAALLCGCSAQQIDNAGNAISSAAPGFVNDALIVTQIEGYFATIDPDSALHTAVSSHGGVVHLSGRVKSASVRDRFIARAKSTQDVKQVVSTLVVDRKVPSLQGQAADVSLTFAIEASLAKEAGINALQVHIDAHGGHVTLTGHVRTPALRETLADAAKKTHGVLSVTDRLTIAQ